MDPNEQFHRNEAISAVVDEGFLGEDDDDDDDYEDLYNDVNVGEGFLQSLRKNEELGFKKEEEVEKKLEPVEKPVVQAVDDVVGGGERKYESNDGVSSKGNSNLGLGGNEMAGRGSGGLGVELGQSSAKIGEVESVPLNNNSGMGNMGSLGNAGGDGLAAHGSGNVNGSGGNGYGNGGGGGMGMAAACGGGGGVGGAGAGGGGGGTVLSGTNSSSHLDL